MEIDPSGHWVYYSHDLGGRLNNTNGLPGPEFLPRSRGRRHTKVPGGPKTIPKVALKITTFQLKGVKGLHAIVRGRQSACY